jgi:hypothetical protein
LRRTHPSAFWTPYLERHIRIYNSYLSHYLLPVTSSPEYGYLHKIGSTPRPGVEPLFGR